MNIKAAFLLAAILTASTTCSGPAIQTDQEEKGWPEVFPDYTEVTIPPNIAPLNFAFAGECEEARALFTADGSTFEVEASDGKFDIPFSSWKKTLQAAAGKAIQVKVLVKQNGRWIGYAPFPIYVADEPVDAYLAYRLIEPGYELWNQMGIYQRNLADYTESAIMENKMSGYNCMNCHSFCMQNPEQMIFHMRGTYPATLLVEGDQVTKLNTKTPRTLSPLVYPSWHPSGQYIAFSVNTTQQAFHAHDKNRIEVFDKASDVVVYDVRKNEIVTTPLLSASQSFETFPTFSPDGKTLYFCTASARTLPQEYEKVHYNLCAVSFDPDTRSFGSAVDTLYRAESDGKSVSFPRVSPDGKYLLYTLSGYGNFSIWHKDADLYLLDLHTRESRPLDKANSEDVESYHSWSSNSRWIVFSSRRLDGLYTRPFIAYIDKNGQSAKPFLLPQKDTGFYSSCMKSYNIPEFITGKVKKQGWRIGREVRTSPGIDVKAAF